jgi:hypothetical protein
MKLLFRILCLSMIALAFAASSASAQNKVKTQAIRDPKSAEIIRDLSRLPEAVRKKREEILAAARTGELTKVAALAKANGTQVSFAGETDPAEFWKKAFPDSDGLEVMATLIEILESPFVQFDKGSPQEMFVWPYFHTMPLDKLTPEQRVELFRLVTAYDFREMQKFGSYNFFRAGFAPDGTWQFFVAGD